MYSVSDNYISAMNEAVRNQSYFKFNIINLFAEQQSTISSVTSSYALTPSNLFEIAKVSDNTRPDFAAIDADHLTASGNYIISGAINFYTSTNLSTATQYESGYSISNAQIVVNFDVSSESSAWVNADRPVTILFSKNCVRVRLTINNTYTSTFTVDSSTGALSLNLDSIPPSYTGGVMVAALKIEVLSMKKSYQRARIYKVYCGSVEYFESKDVVTVDYSDINDTIMLELPQKTVKVTVNNIYDLKPYSEYTAPRYARFTTQMLAQVGYDFAGNGGMPGIEWIPLGRFFMDSYSVDKSFITFSFIDSLAVQNEYIYYWSSRSTSTLSVRLSQLASIGNQVNPANISVENRPITPMDIYKITMNTSNALNLTTNIYNPCPLISCAQGFQIHANATGNRLRLLRETNDFAIEGISLNLSSVYMLNSKVCFDEDAFEKTDAIKSYSSKEYKFVQAAADTSLTNITIDALLKKYTSDSRVRLVGITQGDPSRNITTYIYAYCYYVVSLDGSATPGNTIDVAVYDKIVTDSISSKAVKGVMLTLDNPLIDGSAITTEYYTDKMYDVQRSNVFLTRKHLGLPFLDAGDLINTDVDGSMVKMLVTENKFFISDGAMTGSTKGRLLQ